MAPQIADARLLAALTADQQEKPEQDHADDRGDLDDGKPELGFAEGLDVTEVDQVDQHEERCGCSPGRNLGPPELYVLADRRELGHTYQDIEHPIVPAGKKPCIATAILVCEMTEGACNRLLDDHFAELTHDQKSNEATNRVAQDH